MCAGSHLILREEDAQTTDDGISPEKTTTGSYGDGDGAEGQARAQPQCSSGEETSANFSYSHPLRPSANSALLTFTYHYHLTKAKFSTYHNVVLNFSQKFTCKGTSSYRFGEQVTTDK